jgi:hypothetical protein
MVVEAWLFLKGPLLRPSLGTFSNASLPTTRLGGWARADNTAPIIQRRQQPD